MKALSPATKAMPCVPRPRWPKAPLPDDAETEEDEGDEQPGLARAEQGANGERRPRRRGRRGGRRRRGGGMEDGLAGSIADELATASAPEASEAVADFDGGSPEPAPSLVSPNAARRPQPAATQPEPARSQTAGEPPTKLPRRPSGRPHATSTVREKVSFFTAPAGTPAPGHGQRARPAPRRHGRARVPNHERTTQGRMVVAPLRRRRITIAFNKKPGQNRAVLIWRGQFRCEARSFSGVAWSASARRCICRSRGWSVALVDRKEPGRKTSYGNAGIIQSGGRQALRDAP